MLPKKIQLPLWFASYLFSQVICQACAHHSSTHNNIISLFWHWFVLSPELKTASNLCIFKVELLGKRHHYLSVCVALFTAPVLKALHFETEGVDLTKCLILFNRIIFSG